MKKSKLIISIVSIALVVVMILAITISAINESGWLTGYTPSYEKPSLGEMVIDGKYPEDLSSSTSINSNPNKEWYEYITYSDQPITDPVFDESGTTRLIYYDPVDYSYGLIMESSPCKNADNSIQSNFDTANSIKYIVKTTYSLKVESGASVSTEASVVAEIEAKVGAGMKDLYWAEVGSKITSKLSSTADVNVKTTEFSETQQTTEKTFDAVYFNSNGAPYAWRVVEYTVYLPLKCDVQIQKDGEWVSTGTDVYCLLATIQGNCRQVVMNGATYTEHWGNGELVPESEFMDGFFTEEALVEAYKNKLLPKMD
ncbi:MAG: hypothetical protein IJ004_01610 [Clostridia bacterium]|nr:hypothetical protein [Clostridia bacterium]